MSLLRSAQLRPHSQVFSTHPASRTLRGRASRTPGAGAHVAEEYKRRSHAAGGTRGYRFVPFEIETYAVSYTHLTLPTILLV